MIPRAVITEWRQYAPWFGDDQVEHDLVLSRALCELYRNKTIKAQLAFRGGTALHKLFLTPAGRFSEDLDFVQVQAQPIGPLVTEIRACLDHWLGAPSWKQNQGRFTLNYTFITEFEPVVKRKVKVEINTREHFHLQGYIEKPIQLNNAWFNGEAAVLTYTLEELMGTKLRALYQRKKGRDLYDFWCILRQHPTLNIKAVIKAYHAYMDFVGSSASRAEFEQNMHQKQQDHTFKKDMLSLLPKTVHQEYNIQHAFELIQDHIVVNLSGEPWKGR